MQPVEHTNHEHASTSLKTILLVFAIVLVGALGYLVWDFNRTEDTTDYSTPVAKKKTETTTKTTTTDETADWKSYTNQAYSFSFKYPKNWENFYVGTVWDETNPSRLFGSSETAKKHKNDDPNTRVTYHTTEPVIFLNYGYYLETSLESALRNYYGDKYNSATVTEVTSDSGDNGRLYLGKDYQSNNVRTVIFSIPKSNPPVSGQTNPFMFLTYTWEPGATENAEVTSILSKIVKTVTIED